ncbi:MAG: nitroreductase family protein, partial [Sedimentibacter sp.]
CWLGGTFKKSDFEQYLSMNENEFIPIVSPVGIKKEKPRLLETAMRAVIGANNKKPWNELFFDGNVSTPLNKNIAGAYDVPIEMVRLGPSASNKQPWRIIKDKNLFHFYLCRNKGYKVGNYDMQKNDLGIATCHFELAAKELGLNGKWEELANINSPKEWEYIITWIEED